MNPQKCERRKKAIPRRFTAVNVIIHVINLCKGHYGINLIKPIKTSTKKTLPEKRDVRIILTSTKLNSQFNMEDVTNKQYKHGLVYFSWYLFTIGTDGCVSVSTNKVTLRMAFRK